MEKPDKENKSTDLNSTTPINKFPLDNEDLSVYPSFVLIYFHPEFNEKLWYRGVSTPPEKVFQEGFQARGADTNLIRHVTAEPFVSKSVYISTSTEKNVATTFAFRRANFSKDMTGYLYEINPQANALDVREALKNMLEDKLIDSHVFKKYAKEAEKAVPHEIKPQDIKGYWRVKIDFAFEGNIKPFSILEDTFNPNPAYQTPIEQSPEFRISKIVGRGATGLAIAIDSVDLYQSFVDSQGAGNFSQFFKTSARIMGSWSGGAALGLIGAKTGTAIGGAIGTVAGGVIGSMAGGMIGGVMAQYLYNLTEIIRKTPLENIPPAFRNLPFEESNTFSLPKDFSKVPVSSSEADFKSPESTIPNYTEFAHRESFKTYDSALHWQEEILKLIDKPIEESILVAYSKAILRGLVGGMENFAHGLLHPFDGLMTLGDAIYDASIIYAKYTPLANYHEDASLTLLHDEIQRNPQVFEDSLNRIENRLQRLKENIDYIKSASGTERVEMLTQVGTNFLVSAFFIKSVLEIGTNLTNFAMIKKPPLFVNTLDDIKSPYVNFKNYRFWDIRKVVNEHFICVITEKSELLITPAKVNPFWRNDKLISHVHHSELGGLKPVLFAGELKVNNGKITSMNNFSGHYLPEGQHLEKLLRHFLVRNGFEEAKTALFHDFNLKTGLGGKPLESKSVKTQLPSYKNNIETVASAAFHTLSHTTKGVDSTFYIPSTSHSETPSPPALSQKTVELIHNSAQSNTQTHLAEVFAADVSVNNYSAPKPPASWVNNSFSQTVRQEAFQTYDSHLGFTKGLEAFVTLSSLENLNVLEQYRLQKLSQIVDINKYAYVDANSWDKPLYPWLNYTSNPLHHTIYFSLERELRSPFPSAFRAFQFVQDRGFSKGFYEFTRLIKEYGLLRSYNGSHNRSMRLFYEDILGMDAWYEIGGVASEVGIIKELLAQPEVFLSEDFQLIFPNPLSANLQNAFKQIQREMSKALYEDAANPLISLAFQNEGALFVTLHPVFQNTLTGQVITYLDYWMKGFLNGVFYPREFLDKWDGNVDDTYLLSQFIDFQSYYAKHGLGEKYISFREFLEKQGINNEMDEKDGQPYLSSFRIIAYLDEVKLKGNKLLFMPTFRVEYSIDFFPHYLNKIEQYKDIHGEYPPSHLKLMQAHEVYTQIIKESMPLVPHFSEYFQMLGMITSLAYFYNTIKKAGKRPCFEPIPLEKYQVPAKLPPYPVAYIENSSITLCYEKLFIEKDKDYKKLIGAITNYIFNREFSEYKKHILPILSKKVLRYCEQETTKLSLNVKAVFDPETLTVIVLEIAEKLLNFVISDLILVDQTIKPIISDYLLEGTPINIATVQMVNEFLENEVQLNKAPFELLTSSQYQNSFQGLTPHFKESLMAFLKKNIDAICQDYPQASPLNSILAAFTTNTPIKADEQNKAIFFDLFKRSAVAIYKNSSKNRDILSLSYLELKKNFQDAIQKLEGNSLLGNLSITIPFSYSIIGFRNDKLVIKGGCSIDLTSTSASALTNQQLIDAINLEKSAQFYSTEAEKYSWSRVELKSLEHYEHEFSPHQLQAIEKLDFINRTNRLPSLTTEEIALPLNDSGATFAHFAVQLFPDNLYINFIKLFPAALYQRDAYGLLPIHYALNSFNYERVQFLLTHNPQLLEEKTTNYRTLLWMAVENGDLVMVKLLLAAGANPNHCLTDNSSILSIAIEQNFVEIAEALINQPTIQLNIPRFDRVTPLHKAISFQMESLALLLINKGCDISVKRRSDGFQAIHLAVKYGLEKVITALQSQCDMKATLDNGCTILHLAAQYQPELIERLLAWVQVDTPQHNGMTALTTAITQGNYHSAKILVNFANPQTQFKKESAICLAYRYGMPDISDSLLMKLTEEDACFQPIIRAYFYQILIHGDYSRFDKYINRFPFLLNEIYDGLNIAEVAVKHNRFALYYAIHKQWLLAGINLHCRRGLSKKSAPDVEWFKANDGLNALDPSKNTHLRYFENSHILPLIQKGELNTLMHFMKSGFYFHNRLCFETAIATRQMTLLAFMTELPSRIKRGAFYYETYRTNPNFSNLINYAVKLGNEKALKYLLKKINNLEPLFKTLSYSDSVENPFTIAIRQKNAVLLKKLFNLIPKQYWPESLNLYGFYSISATIRSVIHQHKPQWLENPEPSTKMPEDPLEKFILNADYQAAYKRIQQRSWLSLNFLARENINAIINDLINALGHHYMAMQRFSLEEQHAKESFLELTFTALVKSYYKGSPHLPENNIFHEIIPKFPETILEKLIGQLVACYGRYSSENILRALLEGYPHKLSSISLALILKKEKTAILLNDLYYKYSNTFNRQTTLLHEAILLRLDLRKELLYRTVYIHNRMENCINEENLHGQTPLMLAIASKDPKAIDFLLKHGAYPNLCDARGYNCLFYAIENNLVDVALQLIPLTYHLWHQNEQGNTALHLAVENGLTPVVRKLCRDENPEKIFNRLGLNPLHTAAYFNQVELIKFFIEINFNIDLLTNPKRTLPQTALQIAIVHNQRAAMKCLMDLGADLSAGVKHHNALSAAIVSHNPDTLRDLYYTQTFLSPHYELEAAAQADNIVVLGQLLLQGVDINAVNKKGRSALHLAVLAGANRVAAQLIQQPHCLINNADLYGYTPLHLAILKGNGYLINNLLNNGADPDKETQLSTPLIFACEHNFNLAIPLLLNYGADVNHVDSRGVSIFDLAQSNNKLLMLIENSSRKPKVRAHRPLFFMTSNRDDLISTFTKKDSSHLINKKLSSSFSGTDILALVDFLPLKEAVLNWVACNNDAYTPIIKDFFAQISSPGSFDANKKIILTKLCFQALAEHLLPLDKVSFRLKEFLKVAARLAEANPNRFFFQIWEEWSHHFIYPQTKISAIDYFINNASRLLNTDISFYRWQLNKEKTSAFNFSSRAGLPKKIQLEGIDQGQIIKKFITVTEDSTLQFPLSIEEVTQIAAYYKIICEHCEKLYSMYDMSNTLSTVISSRKKGINLPLIAILFVNYARIYNFYPHSTQAFALLALLNCPEELKGRLAQIKTGEGKSTLIAILAAYFALQDHHVDIATSTEDLAERDVKKFMPFFEALNLNAAFISHQSDQSMQASILYGMMSTFEFSYLRQGLYGHKQRVLANGQLRPFDVLMLDEADLPLEKEKNMPALISLPNPCERPWIYPFIGRFVKTLLNNEQKISVNLLREHAKKILSQAQQDHFDSINNNQLEKWIKAAISAFSVLKEKNHYVIELTREVHEKEASLKIIIVDLETGKKKYGSAWTDGLMQFVEFKHDIPITRDSNTGASISSALFTLKYKIVLGLSGSIGNKFKRQQYLQRCQLEAIDIPPHHFSRLEILPFKITRAENHFEVLRDSIHNFQQQGRPCLILMPTIEQSQQFSLFLSTVHIKHKLHNEVNLMSEEEIAAFSKEEQALLIATNNAGRGTDFSLSSDTIDKGGLMIIVTAYPDMHTQIQNFGRAARQGEPGSATMVLNKDDHYLLELISFMARQGDFRLVKQYHLLSETLKQQVETIDQEFIQLLQEAREKYENLTSSIAEETFNHSQICHDYLTQYFIWRKEVVACFKEENLLRNIFESDRSSLNMDCFNSRYNKFKLNEIIDLLQSFLTQKNSPSRQAWKLIQYQCRRIFLKEAEYQWSSFYHQASHCKNLPSLEKLYEELKQNNEIFILNNPTEAVNNFLQGLFSSGPAVYVRPVLWAPYKQLHSSLGNESSKFNEGLAH